MKVHFIEFDGRSFPLVEADDGQIYVPVKPICEAIGARWAGQARKMHRGDRYKSTSLTISALDPLNQTIAIPAMRLFGWLTSFHHGLAKDADAQAKNAHYTDGFVDAVAAFVKQVWQGEHTLQPAMIDEQDFWRSSIETRLDRLERQSRRRGEG